MSISITVLIIIITAAVSLLAMNNPDLQHKLMLNPYAVSRRKEYYRFITSGFIHADFMHLGFNMFSFYFFGEQIERFLGRVEFIALYLIAIIASDIPTYLKYRNNPGYNSLGASGGVSAIIFSFIVISPLQTIYVYFLPVPAVIFGLFYLGYSYYMDNRSGDRVNHSAHLYGALIGIVYTFALHGLVLLNFFDQISSWF